MKVHLFSRAAAIAVVWLFLVGAPSYATPPRELYAMSRSGVLYKFDRTTGAATAVRTLDPFRLGCTTGVAPRFYGLLFYNNVFYTTCRKQSGPLGLFIRFGFRPGDEVATDTLTKAGLNYPGFDRMCPVNPSGQPLLIQARAENSNTPFYSPTWGNYHPNSMLYDVYGGGEGNIPVCGANPPINAGLIRFKNPYSSGPYLIAAGLSGGGGSGGAIGTYVDGPTPCFQIECFVATDSIATASRPIFNTLQALFDRDTMRFDTGSGELWSVSYDTTAQADNQPILIKMRSASLTNYCTGTYLNHKAANPGVDDTPRVIGTANITGGPIVGVDFAENYFDFPPAPSPGVPASADCDYYVIGNSVVCL